MNKIFKDCDICNEEIKDLEYERNDDGAVAHKICVMDILADALETESLEMEYDMREDDETFEMEYDIGDDGE